MVSAACAAISDMAVHMQQHSDPFVDRLLATLLKLTSQSKKVVVSLGSSTACTLLRNSGFQFRLLERTVNAATGEKSPLARERACELTLVLVEEAVKRGDSGKSQVLRSGGLDLLDRLLGKGLGDASGSVRGYCRDILTVYQREWPERADMLIESFDISVKKSLARSGSNLKLDVPKVQRPNLKALVMSRPAVDPPSMASLSLTPSQKKPNSVASTPTSAPAKIVKRSGGGGGLVGSSLAISLTPLTKKPTQMPVDVVLQSPPSSSVAEPDNIIKIQRVSKYLKAGEYSEKIFRRICRFSSSYGKDKSTAEAAAWKAEFPSILACLITCISKSHGLNAIQRQNSIIALKYCCAPSNVELLQGYEMDLLMALTEIIAESEEELYDGASSELGAAALDVLQALVDGIPPDIMAQLSIDILKERQTNHALVGVLFKTLAMLCPKFPPASNNQSDLHPLEQSIVIPVFQAGLIHEYISSTRVMTRMAVYDLLLAIWRILGEVFVKQYLVPIDATTEKTKGDTMVRGLRLPSYKLFLVLRQQQESNDTAL
eukprot:Partr_v1_DN27175_c1_g1_i1_m16030 putative Microtubule binding protein that promotes the stabilization of dynamic microtubules. Required for mitotic spindle formation (By similarity)